MPTEHPILFTGPMVRAILKGTKTMTRRVMKPQPLDEWIPETVGWYAPTRIDRHGEEYPGKEVFGASDAEWGLLCPYGAPGDRLWVRETWAPLQQEYKRPKGYGHPRLYRADEIPTVHWCTNQYGCHARVPEPYEGVMPRWRPSIHMPRWASRIILEVTDIRVERVQEIGEEDAKAEGLSWFAKAPGYGIPGCPDTMHRLARDAFAALWDSINAKRGEKILLAEPWDGWTWAESSAHDPEGLALDIAEPAEIRWRNLADHDEAEWMRFGDTQPAQAGMYDVIWEKGDKPMSVYLEKCAEEDGCTHSFVSYAWEANPRVWVVSFGLMKGNDR